MNKKIVFLLGLLTHFMGVNAGIAPAHSLMPIQREIEECDRNTLVLLDIGGTLLVPKEAAFHPNYQEWTRGWIRSHYPELTPEQTIECARTFEGTKAAWRVVNPKWKEVLACGEARALKMVAFTRVHMDPSLLGTRAMNLANHGLAMQNCLPELTFGTLFAYANGVIETGQELKGAVLKEVLSQLKWKPSKIVFVDDRLEQVQSVEAACLDIGIPCKAFYYTEARDNPPPFIEEHVSAQLRALFEEGKWISQETLLPLVP